MIIYFGTVRSSHHWFPLSTLGISPLAVILVLLVPVSVGRHPCPTAENTGNKAYQFRLHMDRCEGLLGRRPITAMGLRLASYTIGEPQRQSRRSRGEVFNLQVPETPNVQVEPSVLVQARSGDYKMKPLRLGRPVQGWREFFWGAELLLQEEINTKQLRATAVLSPPGSADEWLPVKFTAAGAYNLVIASNAPQLVATIRILSMDKRLVHECSGPTRLEAEFICLWNGRDRNGRISPAGRFFLIVRPAGGGRGLNVSLRHDPRWLLP